MSVERFDEKSGQWVPAEPMPEPFGVRWERMMRHRRSHGQSRLRALLGGWLDVRAVDRLAEGPRW